MHNFKNLRVWKESINLVKEVYLLTNKLPHKETYGICSQMQRASVSISSNIAEGSGRSSDKDFARFLEIALSSAFELETQLILCKELNYLDRENYKKLIEHINNIQKMIYGLIQKLKKS